MKRTILLIAALAAVTSLLLTVPCSAQLTAGLPSYNTYSYMPRYNYNPYNSTYLYGLPSYNTYSYWPRYSYNPYNSTYLYGRPSYNTYSYWPRWR